MKKSTVFSIFFISLAILIAAASLYLWQGEQKQNHDRMTAIYSDAFIGFLHAAEGACEEIEAFDASAPSDAALSRMHREAELCSFYVSRLPVPHGMLASLGTFLKAAPEYFAAAKREESSGETKAHIAALQVLASKLKQALSDNEKYFLSAEDPYAAVCDFFDRENYVEAGKGKRDFSAFFLDDILYDMPELSYEGELSIHQRGMGFFLLANTDEFDAKKAREAAAGYLGQNISHYRYAGVTGGFPSCHVFSFGDAYVSVSRHGGYVMAFSLACKVYEKRLSEEALLKIAKDRTEAYGFGACDAEYLYENAGILYFSCVPDDGDRRAKVTLGLDSEYGNTKYLNAYSYYKYYGIDGAPGANG